MLLQQCPPGPQPDWCPRTTDDVLPSVLGLLPPGPAWEGSKVAGTIQNTYWRVLSNVLAYAYDRMCLYVDEFFCATVNESVEQWRAEYAMDDPCDPYAGNLCLKVGAGGGATCDYFVQMAALNGYSITCNVLDEPEPIAGCFEVGCTGLGPTPTFAKWGSNLGYGQIGTCQYGEVVEHPDVQKWENGKTFGATCPVPGSNLGFGPDTDESCCFICGWYEFPEQDPALNAVDYCQPLADVIYFECPRRDVPADPSPCTTYSSIRRGLDDSGSYSEWGNAYIWEVTVDVAASQALQASQQPPPPVDPPTTSEAGNFMVGHFVGLPDGTPGCGTPLCLDTPSATAPTYALCFLDKLKPAHTVLRVKVIQPT